MSSVNLLDWRQRMLRRRLLRWAWLSGGLLLLALTLLLAGRQCLVKKLERRQAILLHWRQADRQLQPLMQRYSELRAQQQKLREQAARRQERRQRLAYWPAFLQQLELSVPEKLWLSSLKHQQRRLCLEGSSQQPDAARLLGQRLRQPPLLADWQPGALQKNADGLYRFTLAAQLAGETDDGK